MSAYFDELERELRAAVPRVAAAHGGAKPRPRRWMRVSLSDLVPTAGVAVALAVAVLALVLVGRHQPSVPHPSSGPGAARVLGAPVRIPTLGQLRANFAALRRVQTAADRTFSRLCDCRSVTGRIPGLTRLVRTLPGGVHVFLTVERSQPARPGTPGGADRLEVWIIDRHRNAVTTDFGPNVNYTAIPLTAGAGGRNEVWASIIPDGASTVRWDFSCLIEQPCSNRTPGSVTTGVLDNVAAVRVPDVGAGCSGCRTWAASRWFGSNGRLVFEHDRATHRNLAAAPFLTPPSPTSPFLFASSIAAVPFGARIGPALRSLNTSLGGSEHVVEHTHGCGYDTVVTWPGVAQSPARSRVEFSLTAFFQASRLVGYRYGRRGDLLRHAVALDPRTGREVARLRLASGRGLTVGDSLARGRALYGGGFTIFRAQGGTWRVRVADGGLAGFAAGPSRHGDVSRRSWVSTIEAGAVGCPALSP